MYKHHVVRWAMHIHWNANKWCMNWTVMATLWFIAIKCSAKAGLSLDAVHMSKDKRIWMMAHTSLQYGQMVMCAWLEMSLRWCLALKDIMQSLNAAELLRHDSISKLLCCVVPVCFKYYHFVFDWIS